MTYFRKREHGTFETLPSNSKSRIKAIKGIIKRKQYAKVDNTMIDLYSASAICQVYDALSDKNKEKFASMSASKMGIFALKFVS